VVAHVDGDAARGRLREVAIELQREVVELLGLLEERHRLHRHVAHHHVREHRGDGVDVVGEADDAQFGSRPRLRLDGDRLADAEPLDQQHALLEHHLAGSRRPRHALLADDLLHLDGVERR